MPRKIRELKAQIAREGFVYLPKRGKGSHERWRHPREHPIFANIFFSILSSLSPLSPLSLNVQLWDAPSSSSLVGVVGFTRVLKRQKLRRKKQKYLTIEYCGYT
jgi:hypothetical protein